MKITLKKNRGNVMFVAFGILIVLFFLGIAFVYLARQAEYFAVSSMDRFATNFAAYSGVNVAVSHLSNELMKEGQFTTRSKLFFKGEDPDWQFESKEENDYNKNNLIDTFNLPIEFAKNVSIEKTISSADDKNLFFRVKIVDESAKLPINDDIRLTSKILQNLSECLNLQLDISRFQDVRRSGQLVNQKMFAEIFGEKYGSFLLQFFTFYEKPISKTLYSNETIRYDGEKIFSISQLLLGKNKIKIGNKPFLNINTATKPIICANFLNLSAFYLKLNKNKSNLSDDTINEKYIKNLDDLNSIGTIKYISINKADTDIFYAEFVSSSKKKQLKTYRDFFNFVFSSNELESKKAELIWVNANPNIDILKFNDIWNYMYVKKESGQFINREIDKLDIVLPTYEISFNSSGIFSVEVEGRYQYKNIILAKHKVNTIVDLMDYIIDSSQEDFLQGFFETAKDQTKNDLTMITYPEYNTNKAKINNIDGQLSLSFNVDKDSNTCKVEYDKTINLKPAAKIDSMKIRERFIPYSEGFDSVFNVNNTPAITPSGILVDGIKTLELPIKSCFDKYSISFSDIGNDNKLYESISSFVNSNKEYTALHIGLSMWIKPSYYSLYNFPLLSIISDDEKPYSYISLDKTQNANIITNEFNYPLQAIISKKFFGCSINVLPSEILQPNKWIHIGLSIDLKSCKTYLDNLKNLNVSEADKLRWYIYRCTYYTLYINGKEINFNTNENILKQTQFIGSTDTSDISKLFIGTTEKTNTLYTVDDIVFYDKFSLLKSIMAKTYRGRYYNKDTKFESRKFFNKPEYLYLLSSEVFTLPLEPKYEHLLCIKFKDATGSTDCYGNILETSYARWNVPLIGNYFNYEIHWKNLSYCGGNTSPIVDSVILNILKKPDIKFAFEELK